MHFAATPRLSTYVMAVVCGDFLESQDSDFHVPLTLAYRRSMKRYIPVQEIFHYTSTGIDYYERLFQVPLPFDHYTQVLVPEMYMGAMENAACVTINDNNLWKEKPNRSESLYFYDTVLHELSHMWFGDLVTFRWWDDIWLNESFATYISYLALAEAFDQDVWAYFYLYSSRGFALDITESTHPVHIAIEDTAQAQSSFDVITYCKGAAIIKALIALVGRESFFQGLADYFGRYKWSNVTMKELLETLQEYTTADLNSWAEAWVATAGVNQLCYCPPVMQQSCFPRTSKVLRSHRVTLKHYNDPHFRTYTESVLQVDSQAETLLPSHAYFTFVGLDSSDYMLVAYTPAQMNTLVSLSSSPLPDPAERAVLWTHFWYMVQTGCLASVQYLTLASHWLRAETCEDLVDFIIRTANSAVFSYLPAWLVTEYADSFLDTLRDLALQGPQTLRPVYRKRLPSFAYTHAAIAQLLDNFDSFGFLRTQKWHLLMAKCAFLSLSEVQSLISEELDGEADSDMGRRLQYYCKASAYDNKECTWQVIREQADTYSLPEFELILEGFNRQVQGDALRLYRSSVFAYLQELIDADQREIVENFIESALPTYEAPREVIKSLSALRFEQSWARQLLQKTLSQLEVQQTVQDKATNYLSLSL